MKVELGDVDIDVPDREKVLNLIDHIVAMRIDKGKKVKHNTGVYVQNIEQDIETGLSLIDHENEIAQKVDILNFSPLERFRSNEQLQHLISIEPDWGLLKNKEFVQKTTHIHKWFDMISKMNIDSVEKLAMFLAIIRPSKEYLRNKSWDYIEKNVWKDEGKGYTFKKSHAFGYALTIVAYMNLR